MKIFKPYEKEFQSTPSARRATAISRDCRACGRISIHALREEGDHHGSAAAAFGVYFNPRPPRGGRRVAEIATHLGKSNFNPRPPRGGRLTGRATRKKEVTFQSTPSARRATVEGLRERGMVEISIHALREEGDTNPC